MSKSTRASAPDPLELEAEQATRRKLRIDPPHAERPFLRRPLAWTDYVQPSVAASPLAATLPPAAGVWSACVTTDGTAAEPCLISRSANTQPVLRILRCDRDVRTGVRRQRFYPQQWRRLQQPVFERLVRAHGHSLQWIGWERSLPRLYLPASVLTRVVLDLLQLTLRRLEPSDLPEQTMFLRAGSQSSHMQALVLVLEHPRLELSPAVMQYLNAPLAQPAFAVQDPPDAEEVVRVRQLLQPIGGTISASRSREGGTQFRLSIPADDRMTLVRAWLEQVAHHPMPIRTSAQAERSFVVTPSEHDLNVYQSQVKLFVVGRSRPETIGELQSADAKLQALSGSGDLVYRAARGRWLWLSMHSDLPALDSSAGWQSQLISQWNCLVESALLTEQQIGAFHSLARAIVAKMDFVLGRREPPLDVLVAPPPRSRHVRVDRPAVHRLAGPSEQPARVSLGVGATSSIGRRRWRYPI